MLCPKDPALQADPQLANAVVDNKVAVPIVVTAVNVRENMFTHLSNVTSAKVTAITPPIQRDSTSGGI